MEVILDKRYPLAVSVEQAWAVLCDLRATAQCMPGATITEQLDDTHFKGQVKTKLGPATMTFGGDIELLGVDTAAHQLRMLGKGVDKAGSSASMELTAHMEAGETPASSVLVGHAVVIVNGKLAQFGSRLLVPVSDMLLSQFAVNFGNTAAVVHPVPQPQSPAVAGDAPDVLLPLDAVEPPSRPAPVPAPATPPPVHQAQELNALAMGWMLFKNWWGGLFGKRA
jgi:carbon monoxide dehydrogenase subunit G